METTKSYTIYQLKKLERGSVKWQLRWMGWIARSLQDAKSYRESELRDERFRFATPHDEVRILRIPDGPHAIERLQWLACPMERAKALSKKSYLVMAPMHGEEEGTDWLVGCYPTIKAAKEHAGHYGWLVGVIHMDTKKEWQDSQPAPVTRDLWRVG